MNLRNWIVAGAVTGTLALVLLTALVTLAFGTSNPPIPKLIVIGVADLLFGVASLKLLGDAWTMATIERCTSRYVEGVGDTVDRLASALPQKDNVRRIS